VKDSERLRLKKKEKLRKRNVNGLLIKKVRPLETTRKKERVSCLRCFLGIQMTNEGKDISSQGVLLAIDEIKGPFLTLQQDIKVWEVFTET